MERNSMSAVHQQLFRPQSFMGLRAEVLFTSELARNDELASVGQLRRVDNQPQLQPSFRPQHFRDSLRTRLLGIRACDYEVLRASGYSFVTNVGYTCARATTACIAAGIVGGGSQLIDLAVPFALSDASST